MTFYTDFIYYSGTNSPVANQAVTIKDHGTDTKSTIYDGTGAVIANPIYTDTLGKFEFYVADGAATYDIYVNSVIYDSFSSTTYPEKLNTANPSATGTFTLNGADLTSDFTKLHAVTASAAELNIMDGVTTSTQELNYVDGVTSGIQAQINTKAATGGTIRKVDISVEWNDGDPENPQHVSQAVVFDNNLFDSHYSITGTTVVMCGRFQILSKVVGAYTGYALHIKDLPAAPVKSNQGIPLVSINGASVQQAYFQSTTLVTAIPYESINDGDAISYQLVYLTA